MDVVHQPYIPIIDRLRRDIKAIWCLMHIIPWMGLNINNTKIK